MEVATAAGRPGILAAGERDLGDLFMYNRSPAEAVTWLRRAADGFDRLGDAAGLSRTLESLAFVLYRQGAYADALETAERINPGGGGRRSRRAEHRPRIMGVVQMETGHPRGA